MGQLAGVGCGFEQKREKTHRHGPQCADCWGVEVGGGRGVYGGLVVMDGDLTGGGEHTIQCTDNVF